MKQIIKSLEKFVKNQSIRTIILVTILFATIFLNIVLAGTLRMNLKGMRNLGYAAYKSNSEINDFSECLSLMEKHMENYVIYHTFESIDSFYLNRGLLEELCDSLQGYPSQNDVLQKEYIVNQLARSFIFYSNKTIAARRAYSSDEVTVYYKKSIDCYNILISELLELNKLLLQRNAGDYEYNLSRLEFVSTTSTILLILLSVIVMILLYVLITSITEPLTEISEVAHRVSKRDFNVPLFNNDSTNEIGNICQAFERMIISIREYIDTIWEKATTEAELKEKEIEMQALYIDAQLRALQNQINPHFLFNTLNTGAQLAMMEGADKTCYFIEQVSDFFRYKIQNQGQTASINDELGLVDNFVYIMQVRFGKRLTFIKNVPSVPLKAQIPIMTLQPLVENCIKHGLSNEQGEVILTARTDDKFIEITVSDNGEGMSEEIKQKVFDAVKADKTQLPEEYSQNDSDRNQHTGTGLVNVFLRLKLYFHRDDIFDITLNENGKGTKFIIRIPNHV